MAPMHALSFRRYLAAIPMGLVAALVIAGPALAHGAVPAAPPSVAAVVLGWDLEPAVAVPLVVVAIWWWRILAGIDRRHPEHPVPKRRRWAFLAGLAAIAIAL